MKTRKLIIDFEHCWIDHGMIKTYFCEFVATKMLDPELYPKTKKEFIDNGYEKKIRNLVELEDNETLEIEYIEKEQYENQKK